MNKLEGQMNNNEAIQPEAAEQELATKQIEAKKNKLLQYIIDRYFNNGPISDQAEFNPNIESIPQKETRIIVQESAYLLLTHGRIDVAMELKNEFNLPDDVFMQQAQYAIIDSIYQGNVRLAMKINNILVLPAELITSEEVQEAVKQAIIAWLPHNTKTAMDLKDSFKLSDELIASKEVQEAVKKETIKLLKMTYYDQAIQFMNEFHLSAELIASKEVQEVVKENLPRSLRISSYEAIKLKNGFNLSEDEFIRTVKEVIVELLADGDTDQAIAFKNQLNLSAIAFMNELNLSPEIIKAIEEHCLELLDSNDTDNINELRMAFGLKPDKTLEVANHFFGAFLNKDLYMMVDKLLSTQSPEGLPQELKDMGVTNAGTEGLQQFKRIVAHLRSSFLQPDYNGDNLDTHMAESIFKKTVRYENSEWGGHDDESFQNIVDYHRAFRKQGLINDLPEAYAPSEVMAVKRIDRVEQLAFEYSEQLTIRYAALRQSILEAKELSERKNPLNDLAGQLLEVKEQLVGKLEAKLAELKQNDKTKPIAINGLSLRLSELQAVNFRSVKDLENNFITLTKFKEFEPLLRKFIFFLSFHDYRNQKIPAKANLAQEKPDIDNLAWTLEFIDHITNQETKNRYFKNDQAKEAFIKITNARALAEEYTLAQNQATRGTTKMQFIPTRGLLMEFSGHIADACWASKEDSIAKNHPNFSAMTMVQNPGTADERLAGSCILIETESKAGVPLLIIRGLNPIENIATRISAESFFESVTGYLKNTAAKLNRRLAIVIDNNRGGSASNRQSIYDYLDNNCRGRKVTLKSNTDSFFNGYDIVNDCYIVE